MKEVLRTNNIVYLSFAQSVLDEAGIAHLVFDTHMSVLEGSIGALPRRLMVDDDQVDRARAILAAAEPGDLDSGDPDIREL
jgi:hypothetical protein